MPYPPVLSPPLLRLIVTRIYQEILVLKYWVILAGAFGFAVSSYALLLGAGEVDLTQDWVVFVYFLATTASTVGYGDFSPSTPSGMLIASFYIYPGGIILFGVIAGKIAAVISERIRKMASGLGDFSSIMGVTLVVGYHEDRTSRIIRDITAGQDDDGAMVLMSVKEAAQAPAGIKFIRASRLDSSEDLARAGAENASKVLIYADSDAETLNAALAVRDMNKTAVISAYFNDRTTANRAESLAQISVIVSHSPELLVRAVQDPGAETVLGDLITASQGHTIYSDTVPSGIGYDHLKDHLQKCGAIVIAAKQTGTSQVSYELPDDIPPNTTIFYIAASRLTKQDWTNAVAVGSRK